MNSDKLKAKCHKDIKPSIKAAGVIHNENNTRLWWKEGNKTGNLTIVYDNPNNLKEIAAVLKECVLIDDYWVTEIDHEVISVQLYKKEYYEYKVGDKNIFCTRKTKVNWRELKINRIDVFEIANYMIYQRCIKGEPLGKVVSMFRNSNHSTKKTA